MLHGYSPGSPPRPRRRLLAALLPLLLLGLLASGAGHALQHGDDDAGQPCVTCHLTATAVPEALALERAGTRVEPLFGEPARGPELRAPAARLAARAPPERIDA